MHTIAIRESQKIEGGFAATVSVDGRSRHDITVRDPFDAKQEQDLEFYFEEWIRFPFDEQVRAQRAAASVKNYGEALFDAVFKDKRAYSDYRWACENGLSELRIEIEGNSPAFQALHWEALKDPDLPRPLAVECVFTRKRFQERGPRIELKPSSEINLLVVTARPDEESDVGYRTISRPLIEAIERGRLRVNVELLRPGTFAALSEHLERKEGFYHIVHFDAHGGLMSYAQYMTGAQNDRYVFQARRGRRDIESYEGEKSFLFLEGAQKGQADPVEAQELADLLVSKGIPVCILNACQSGREASAALSPGAGGDIGEVEARETSLGSRLMAAGIQTVVAMGYSVTVSAAALMMKRLYGALFEEKGVPEAIRLGRKELHEDRNRRVYFNQVVELEDWLLPVVYANGEVDLRLVPLSGRERAEALVARGERYRFAEPTYGFVGRDLEILKIEKALLRHNVLLLQGMGGTGKTTLLNYLRAWWQTTGFAREVFYFGYDESAYTLQQMLRVMGKRLYADGYEFNEFEAMPVAAQAVDVADRLRAEPYGLVLDNLESVTGQALAIMNTLSEEEREKVRDFLLRLRGGRTKVMLGSRSSEDWLADVFTAEGQKNWVVLGGLDPESRTVLAEKILAAQVKEPKRIAALRKDEGFKRLMKLLAGYPLAMEVVLGNLARQSPQEVLDGLDAADVEGFDVGGEEKTNNILKCVEYSHSNLSGDMQKLLVCLAPFDSFLTEVTIVKYVEKLQKHKSLSGYKFDLLDNAIQEAVRWGLLSAHESKVPSFLNIQPLFPYFLRIKLNELSDSEKNAIRDSFGEYYQVVAGGYHELMSSSDANTRRIGLIMCELDYNNIYNGFKIVLAQRKTDSFDTFISCLNGYFYQIGDRQKYLELSKYVYSKIESYPESCQTEDAKELMCGLLDEIATGQLESHDYHNALNSYQTCLKMLSKLRWSEQQKRVIYASTYRQLGTVFRELKEYEEARHYSQKALDLSIELGNAQIQAHAHHSLGLIAEESKDYKQAQAHYECSLELLIKSKERYPQAATYHQLGSLTQRLCQYEKAQSHYQQALDISIEFDDYIHQAVTLAQIGILEQELKKYDCAREKYQQALDITINLDAQYEQAYVYHQLGCLSLILEDYEQAKAHLKQALKLYKRFVDQHRQASTEYELGRAFAGSEEYGQSQKHFLKALEIFVESSSEPNAGAAVINLAKIYGETQNHSLLADVARCLNLTVEEVNQLFDKLNSGGSA